MPRGLPFSSFNRIAEVAMSKEEGRHEGGLCHGAESSIENDNKSTPHVYSKPPPPFHYFKSKENSSLRTRIGAGKMLRIFQNGVPHRSDLRLSRKNARDNRLSDLHTPTNGTPIQIAEGESVYFIGNPENVPACIGGKKQIPVSSLHVASNSCGEGSYLKGVFTLVPCSMCKDLTNKSTYDAMKIVVTKTKSPKSNARGKHRRPQFESTQNKRYVTIGMSPYRNRTGMCKSLKGIEKMPSVHCEISQMVNVAEDLAVKYLPDNDIFAISKVHNLLDWKGFPLRHQKRKKDSCKHSKIWAAIACSINGFLPAHIDNDFFWSGSMVLSDDGWSSKGEVLSYFCFPEYGIAVPLCSGQLILFNPRVLHCISTRKTTKDIVCMSFYLKSEIIGGHDNDLPLTNEQLKILNAS